MKIAIMQPYLFPYIGYFQLIAGVDKFIFLDDVNFKKRGWINRNRLLLGGDVRYITVPLSKASQFEKINRITIQKNEVWQRRVIESVRHSYSKAPNYGVVSKMFFDVILSDEEHISALATKSVLAVAKYLGLKTDFVTSSSCYGNSELHGVARVLDICRRENAGEYHNLPGGRRLYDRDRFEAENITLRFVEPVLSEYKQISSEFHPGLSVIDVLMSNDRESVRKMLHTEGSH